jgi:hypothetical protein
MSDVGTAAPVTGSADQAGRLARMRVSSLGAVGMLIVQFILGIIYNLYGTAPTATKSVGMFSSPLLAFHVILGFLLLIAAIGQLVRAIGTRHRLAIWMSAGGLAGILGALFAGMAFVGDGAAGSSLGMALAFAVALACYAVLVFALPSSTT